MFGKHIIFPGNLAHRQEIRNQTKAELLKFDGVKINCYRQHKGTEILLPAESFLYNSLISNCTKSLDISSMIDHN